jgi:Arylsulfotransferase (ASST)
VRLVLQASLLGLVLLLLGVAAEATGATRPPPLSQHFVSRPDLKPPVVHVRTHRRGTTGGYVFLAPKLRVAQAGPLILDDSGQVVWFKPLDTRGVTDFRVQRYHGQPVLTWWRGRNPPHARNGFYVIYDSTYHKVADVHAGNKLVGDIHEFRITPRDTALITIYHRRHADLSPVGGPKDGQVYDGIVQEIDIATKRVLFEWHSFPQVGVKESYARVPRVRPGKRTSPYDYFHINSIDPEPNGNFLVSSRNTHALYEIDRSTGKILWRLGGKRSDFRFGPGARFAWQHDARRQPDGTITLFDNGAAPAVEKFSRVLVLRVDEAARKVTLVRSYHHPRRLLSPYEGNAQFLPNGHVFVGWGSNPDFTEFDQNGRVVLDASFGRQGGRPGSEADSYRAYRFDWTGRPTDDPRVAMRPGKLYVSWNGATGIERWDVFAGADPQHLRRVATHTKTGFETAIPFRAPAGYVEVQAVARDGDVLGTSAVLKD